MSEWLLTLAVLVGVAVFLLSVYALINRPTEIDAEESASVAAETPEEHARAILEGYRTPEEENQADEDLYSSELP